jgi:hypothetical protein
VADLDCILEDTSKDQEIGFVSLDKGVTKNNLMLMARIKPLSLMQQQLLQSNSDSNI